MLAQFVKSLSERYPVFGLSFGERIRFNFILSNFKDAKGTLLDVGCGTGGLGKILETNGMNVTYLDIKPHFLKHLKGKDRLIADGSALPFREKSFDFTVSADAIEHVSQFKRVKFIQELLGCAKTEAALSFSQLHTKNPNKQGIFLFESLYKFLELPYPTWYQEHNLQKVIHPSQVERMIQMQGHVLAHKRAYRGLLGVFFLGALGALASWPNKGKKPRGGLTLFYYCLLKFLDWFAYLFLSLIDLPPYYCFTVAVEL